MVQVVFQTTKVVLVIFAAAHSRGCQDGRGGRLQGSLQNTLFKGGKISKRNLDHLLMSKQACSLALKNVVVSVNLCTLYRPYKFANSNFVHFVLLMRQQKMDCCVLVCNFRLNFHQNLPKKLFIKVDTNRHFLSPAF